MPAKTKFTADQLEFEFAPHVSMDMRVDRLPDGRVLLSQGEVRVMGTTAEAAASLGVNPGWVRERLEAGLIRGQRVGRNWKVDMIHVQEIKEKGRNF